MLRNLFYSVYATRHTDEWLDNVRVLSKYADVFTGRKIVVIRSDGRTQEPSEAQKLFSEIFGLEDIEFVHRANNPQLGEVEGFLEDFDRLRSDREGITFYAHTKGASYSRGAEILKAICSWRNAMYHGCLGDIAKVEEVLQSYACTGCFKALFGRCNHRWHYSGNFWWVNNARLFSRDWRHVQQDRYGIEGYLGDVFEQQEAHCLAFAGLVGLYGKYPFECTKCGFYLYSVGRWKDDYPNTCPCCGGGMVLLREGTREHRRAKSRRWNRRLQVEWEREHR